MSVNFHFEWYIFGSLDPFFVSRYGNPCFNMVVFNLVENQAVEIYSCVGWTAVSWESYGEGELGDTSIKPGNKASNRSNFLREEIKNESIHFGCRGKK